MNNEIDMDNLSFEDFTKLALRTESKIDSAQMDTYEIKRLLEMFVVIGTMLDYNKKGIFYNNYTKHDDNRYELLATLNDLSYLKECSVSRETVTSEDINFRVFHGLLGILTEASELAEILLKYMTTEGDVDRTNVLEELSDCGWYKAILFNELQLDDKIGMRNVILKLQKRFPNQYSDFDANNRDLEAERAILEQGIVQT